MIGSLIGGEKKDSKAASGPQGAYGRISNTLLSLGEAQALIDLIP